MELRLETRDLELRAAHTARAGALLDYYQRNRAFLAPWEPRREEAFYTLAAQYEQLEQEMRQAETGTAFRFYLTRREEPEQIIGGIGLSSIVRGCFQSCFLGYKLDGGFTGRGYMTQAVQAVTDFGFGELGLHRIEGNVMPRNRASLRVLEKCGFQKEGISPRYLKINGVWEDHIHMVRLQDEDT